MLSFYNDNLDTKELKFLFKLTIAINLILVVFGLNTFFKFNKNESTGRLTTHRWKQTLGRAQMAENSGDIKEAINLYIEAINLLEGDFAYLKDDQAYGRDQRVQEMRLKVNHLSELKKNGKDKI